MEKTEAVEMIVQVFKTQNERINILGERTDLLLENAKDASECITLLTQRILSLENQVHTLLTFIVTGITTPTDDEKDVH